MARPRKSNVVSLADFRSNREARPECLSYKFDNAPIVPGVAIAGWYDAVMTMRDAAYFGPHIASPPRARWVSVEIAIRGEQRFVVEAALDSGLGFRWPPVGSSIAIAANFKPLKHNGQPASRLVEITDASMVAVAA